MAEDTIKFVGDASQMIAEQQKIIAALEKEDEALQKVGKTAKQIANENAKLDREAEKIKQANITALEKYEQAQARVNALVKAGKLSQEEANREMAKQHTLLKESEQAQRERSADYIAKQQAILQAIHEEEEARKHADEQAAKDAKDRLEAEKKAAADKAALDKQHAADRDAIAREGQQLLSRQQQLEEDRFRRAKQIHQETRTPLEQYNAKVKELDDLLQGQNITQEEHTRAMGKARESYRQSSSIIGQMKAGMMEYAGAIGIALTAARLLQNELADIAKLREKDRQENAGFAGSMERARLNFVPDATVGRDQLDTEMKALAAKHNVSTDVVANVAEGAFSGKGSQDNRFAFNAMDAALSLTSDPNAARELAAKTGDYGKHGESTDPDSILFFLSQAQKAARIESVQKFGIAGAPVTLAGKKAGMSIETSNEMFSAFNTLMGDVTGEQSSTAFVSLLDKLQKFDGAKGTPEEKLAAIQADPKLQEKFFEEFKNFETKAKPAIREMLAGSEGWRKELKNAQELIPSLSPDADADNSARFLEEVAFVRGKGTKAGTVLDRQMAADSNIQQGRLASGKETLDLADIRRIYELSLNEVDVLGPNNIMRPQYMSELDEAMWDPSEHGGGTPVEAAGNTAIGRLKDFSKRSTNKDPGTQMMLNQQIQLLQSIVDESRAARAEANQHALGNEAAIKDAAPKPENPIQLQDRAKRGT